MNGKADAEMKGWKNAESMKAEDFSKTMDTQLVIMKDVINNLSDEELGEQVEFFGGRPFSKAQVVLMIMKIITAYRMQLFLYLKQSGREDIGTMNNWAGMDTI